MYREHSSSISVCLKDIHQACRMGDLRSIRHALSLDPSLVNARDPAVMYIQLNWTPIYRSTVCGHFEIVQLLLENGADPNIPNNLNETSLSYAVENRSYELAQLLLSYGADPNLQRNDGDIPLHVAVNNQDFDIVKLLLDYKSDPNFKNQIVSFIQYSRTPLHNAAEKNSKDIAQLLINYGASLYMKDAIGQTPVDRAPPQLQDALIQFSDTFKQESQSCLSFQLSASGTFMSRDKFSDEDTIILKSIGDSENERIADDVLQTFASLQNISNEQSALKQWLEDRNLEEAYEPLVMNNYTELGTLIKLVRTSQLNPDELKKIGIHKPGIRERLIVRLEQAAGMLNTPFIKSQSLVNASTVTSCASCIKPGSPKSKSMILYTHELSEWLSELDLEHLHPLFIATGYNDFEDLLLLAYAKEARLFQNLLTHIGIEKKSYRLTILNSLKKEFNRRFQSEFSTLIENNSTNVACNSCELL
jgi:hypothetical protein